MERPAEAGQVRHCKLRGPELTKYWRETRANYEREAAEPEQQAQPHGMREVYAAASYEQRASAKEASAKELEAKT